MKERKGVTYDVELTAADLKELAEQFKPSTKSDREDFPSDPKVQLTRPSVPCSAPGIIPRQRLSPRQRHPLLLGHCCQCDAHGVRQPERQFRHRRRFTRDPATGEKRLMGEFLTNAQARTWWPVCAPHSFRQDGGEVPRGLRGIHRRLQQAEEHYRDMQDWILPWKTASSTCISAATASAPPRLP
jgi:pyruvate,orthophosphate dikinase